MANFEAFSRNKKLSANLFFLKIAKVYAIFSNIKYHHQPQLLTIGVIKPWRHSKIAEGAASTTVRKMSPNPWWTPKMGLLSSEWCGSSSSSSSSDVVYTPPNNSLWVEHASKLLWLLCDVWGAQFTSQVSSLANNMVKTAAVARPTIMAASAKTCLLPLCPMDRWPSRWAWAKSVGAALSICISMPYDVFWYLMVLLPPTSITSSISFKHYNGVLYSSSTVYTNLYILHSSTAASHNHIFRISNWNSRLTKLNTRRDVLAFFPLGLILLLEHNLILKPSRMSLQCASPQLAPTCTLGIAETFCSVWMRYNSLAQIIWCCCQNFW